MKKLIPFSLAMSLATAGILYSESQAKALTWSFDYTSDTSFNSGAGYGSQSGSFVEPSTGSDGPFGISSFQFNHTDLGNFDTTAGSSFFGSPTVTITGGAVTDINLVVNNAAETASFEMLFSIGFSQATIYNEVNGGTGTGGTGTPIDGSDFDGVSFSQSGAGADYEFNPVPAVLILSIGFAIKKLSQKLRDKKNQDSSRNGDAK